MKKVLLLLLTLVLCFSLGACGGGGGQQAGGDEPEKQEEIQPPDLAGEWKQANPNSEDMYHIATISGEAIEIYWYDASTETKSLYWAGTYVAPTTADEPYTWDSANDKEKTDVALLASGDDTKTFTYSDGQISYEASAMGSTQTVRLEKQ